MVSTSQNYESAQVFELLRVAGWKICEEESKYYAPWSESDNLSREKNCSAISKYELNFRHFILTIYNNFLKCLL